MAAAALKEKAARFIKENGWKSVRPLPHEALEWDKFECDLFFWTFGTFHPRKALLDSGQRHGRPLRPASFMEVVLDRSSPGSEDRRYLLSTKGRVSVIVPTIEARRGFHESLWESFENQRWPDKELIIVETYHTKPSGFLAELAQQDPRVTYVPFKRRLPNGKQAETADRRALLGGRNEICDFSTGLKRNIGIYVASGEYIAHFDDDDLYAPCYLTVMVKKLRASKASAVKLSTWHVLDLRDGAFTQCDPRSQGILPGYRRSGDSAGKEGRLYGCGFSYVYHRSVALTNPFNNITVAEDYPFIARILDEGGKEAVALMKDANGICLHVQHDKNLTQCIPAKDMAWAEVLTLEFAKCPGFCRYREIIHVGAAMPEFVDKRFEDVPKEVHGDLEIALLNDWSQECCLGTATGKESSRSLDALLAQVGMAKDKLRQEVIDFMQEKFAPEKPEAPGVKEVADAAPGPSRLD